MNHFQFLMPAWLWGFPPLTVLGLILWVSHDVNNIWQRVCDKHLYFFLIKDKRSKSNRGPLILFLVACFFALIAMAGPSWGKVKIPLFKRDDAHMLVLDLSNSMNANDLTPSRLARAKYKVRDILEKLQEGEVGLIVFSGEAFLASPLTEDSQTIAAMIPLLTQDILPIGGQDLSAAIQKASQVFQQAGVKQGDIIVLTDAKPTASAFDAAKDAKSRGYRLSILGMGTEVPVPILLPQGGFEKDSAGQVLLHRFSSADLKTLAEIGGGKYVNFTEDDRDRDVLLQRNFSEHFSGKMQSNRFLDYFQDEGRRFVFPILFLSLWGFRRGRFEKI